MAAGEQSAKATSPSSWFRSPIPVARFAYEDTQCGSEAIERLKAIEEKLDRLLDAQGYTLKNGIYQKP